VISVCGKQGTPSENTCTTACVTGDGCKQFRIQGVTTVRCVPDSPTGGKPAPGTSGSCLVVCSDTNDPCGNLGLTCCKPAAAPEGNCQANCKIP
jgi:hypothetical protein